MSTDIKNNGPAFPVIGGQQVYTTGMSLRDWFAGQALVGILSDETSGACNLDKGFAEQLLAPSAYRMADAMLKARGESND